MALRNPMQRGAASLAVICGLVLVGCAGTPAQKPVSLEGERAAAKFNTGRITVYVTDFAGRPLKQAMVNVESSGRDQDEYFRTAAFSDVWGRVSFSGVPGQVRVSVYHAETQGNYSRVFDVPSTGTTELRMLLETEGQ